MISLFISEKETALLLGASVKWLHENQGRLEEEAGFPPLDPILGKRHRPSIEAWAQARAENLCKKIERVKQSQPKGNLSAF